MTQFLDHLANDVMPALIDRLAAGAPKNWLWNGERVLAIREERVTWCRC